MVVRVRENHRWTDYEKDVIRSDYKHTRESAIELADRLGVTEYAVKGQIAIMGIAKSDDRHPWSPEEKERLAELMTQYCPRRVARKMHRSINSVVVMAKRLNISRRYRTGWFTKREVCEILGHDHRWVQRRIDSGALVATYHHEARPQRNGMRSWHISEQDLIHFIRKYPEEIVGCNMDIMMIVELLAGIISDR